MQLASCVALAASCHIASWHCTKTPVRPSPERVYLSVVPFCSGRSQRSGGGRFFAFCAGKKQSGAVQVHLFYDKQCLGDQRIYGLFGNFARFLAFFAMFQPRVLLGSFKRDMSAVPAALSCECSFPSKCLFHETVCLPPPRPPPPPPPPTHETKNKHHIYRSSRVHLQRDACGREG